MYTHSLHEHASTRMREIVADHPGNSKFIFTLLGGNLNRSFFNPSRRSSKLFEVEAAAVASSVRIGIRSRSAVSVRSLYHDLMAIPLSRYSRKFSGTLSTMIV